MLHNSLFRRDELKDMNRHPLALARRDVHRNVGRHPGAKAAAGQVILDGAWAVQPATTHPAERLVADDAADFLTRMGVTAEAATSRPAAAPAQTVLLEVGSCERGFRCVLEPGRVEVHGADAAGLWAGWVYLENEMRGAGGPVLRTGQFVREPAWDVQIAPPSWGANYAVPDLSPEFLGDDTFRALAHQGADGMFVYGDWLLYATGTRFPTLDHPDARKHLDAFRDVARRAAGYGVKLYFVPLSPKLPADHPHFQQHPASRGALLHKAPDSRSGAIHCLCSSDPDALGFHADVFGTLFREVPDLGGLVLIIGGESYYHCFMRAAGAGVGRTNCPRCDGKLAEDVIAHLLKVTADAARQHQPKAHVTAWPYSAQAFWSREPNQLQLIDRLPEGVALQTEIDKDQTIAKTAPDGRRYGKAIWDYSVDFVGPSDRIVAQALRCAERGRDLFIKTETSHGIELLHFPYVPSLTRAGRRWQALRTVRPRGILQRWGFVGMFDSAAERLGWQARWDPDYTPDGACLAVARQLCGASAAPQIVEAWRAFDEAVGHIPTLTTGPYYLGPAFLGPCHPLPVWEGETPAAFRGSLYYLTELDATFTEPRPRGGDDLTIRHTSALGPNPPIDVIEAEFAAARDAAGRGHATLSTIALDPLPAGCRAEIREQQLVGEYLYRQFFSAVSTIRFFRARESGAAKATLADIAREELANAVAARKVYEAAPWLNHALRLDIGAPDSLVMIDEKVRLLQDFIE